MTIEERLDKLERWCTVLESNIVINNEKLGGLDKILVRWIPKINLPEKAKTPKETSTYDYISTVIKALHLLDMKLKDLLNEHIDHNGK